MKYFITILLFIIAQKGNAQSNSYTAYWRINPNSGVTLFTVQRSSDQTHWINSATVTPNKDTLSYKAQFTAFANNFIRVQAKTIDTTWSSPIIQVVAALPVIISKFGIKVIKVKK